MSSRGSGPDFIEALARGLDVIRAFSTDRPTMSLSQVAAATDLARPTARRILITLGEMGFVTQREGRFELTPRVLELAFPFISAQNLWSMARPHMERLVQVTNESSSIAQLDGSDIVYVARVAVPKIITLSVVIGTRFPAIATSMGHVLLAELSSSQLDEVLQLPSRSGIAPRVTLSRDELEQRLAQVREHGWAIANEELARGIRSAAVPLRSAHGEPATAALNVTVHAAETSMESLMDEKLPALVSAGENISADWGLVRRLPIGTCAA